MHGRFLKEAHTKLFTASHLFWKSQHIQSQWHQCNVFNQVTTLTQLFGFTAGCPATGASVLAAV